MSSTTKSDINFKNVAMFLIPTDMLIGRFPTKEFLKECDLEKEFKNISFACMNGDIVALDQQIDINMSHFLKSGVYFAIEKLKMVTYRNLLKKIHICIKNNPDN